MPARTENTLGANGGNEECKISRSDLLRVLHGVAVATKTSEEDTKPIIEWISSRKFLHQATLTGLGLKDEDEDSPTLFSLHDGHAAIESELLDEDSRQLASLALGVAFLRQQGRQQKNVAPSDLSFVWSLVYGALTSSLLKRLQFSASRSAQGFLAVPLCSLIKDGNIDELFRLHVWLPDGHRGNSEFAIHSHQPFAQSWILAGEGKDHSFKVESVTDISDATHAEYALSWNDGKNHGKAYKTHQTYSVVVNTQKLVRTTPVSVKNHIRNMNYSIPKATFHRTEVAPHILHATLFFFDASRGFEKDAGVLGPKDGESLVQLRDPIGITAATLASAVETLRLWEIFMEQGQQHSQRAEWEEALRAFNSALSLCETVENFPNVLHYKYLVLGELGNTNRRFGRYEHAKDVLEQALAEMAPSLQRVEFSGELGVIYRHMNRLVDAKHAFEDQYNTAKKLGVKHGVCRAIGNLGMVNYQLFQQSQDNTLLQLAIEQLNERVETARSLEREVDLQNVDQNLKARLKKHATTWETIGLSRLSLCYSSLGDTKEAVKAALESLNITSASEDLTVIAMSHFFYGRALLLDGQREKALEQFNPPQACTPAIALCKEPSEEHRKYLQELIEAGADMGLVDEQGYSALDYATFNGDAETEQIVIEGLRQSLGEDAEKEIAQRQAEARLRRGYRELFQEKLRPVLLSGNNYGVDSNATALHNLRRVYADALAADEKRRKMFDHLKFIRYSDFSRIGRLPRSSDGLVQEFVHNSSENYRSDEAEFIIFISYRWINKDSNSSLPDDENNTQYKRMIKAAEEFLRTHPSIDRKRLNIWLDLACINQDDPMPGVCALPMVLAQCDAVISLVDDEYHTRAWCSVEVMMIQTLKKSYNFHLWYDHVNLQPGEKDAEGDEKWVLREGPMDLDIIMADKQLTFEDDRSKVLFLERQTRLFG